MNPLLRRLLLILCGIAIAISFLSFFSAKDPSEKPQATSNIQLKTNINTIDTMNTNKLIELEKLV